MSTEPRQQINASPPQQESRWTRGFERLLWQSRFLVMLAVLPSLIGAVVLFVIGSLDIFAVLLDTVVYYTQGMEGDLHETVVTDIIIAVDIYLIAIVLMIFGLGVYRLFVSQIEESDSHSASHPFNVASFDQLKDKIARVVILAVIIEFFRAVVNITFQTPLEAIYLALSALALAAALYLMSLTHKQV